MRISSFFFAVALLANTAHGQMAMSRYNQLIMSIAAAPDKLSVAKQLVDETEKNYKPRNLEYFNGYITAGMHVSPLDPRLAIAYLENAIRTFHENEAAYNAIVFDDSGIVQAYAALSGAYNSLGLVSTSLQVLELRRTYFENATNNGKATYYNLLGDQYMSVGERTQAKACYSLTGKIMASGELMVPVNKKDPKWKRDMLANLEKVYRDSRSMFLNSSLGEYYYSAGQYDSALTYMMAGTADLKALNQFTEDATKVSKFATMLMPDTMKVMVRENKDYHTISGDLSGANTRLVIALFKSGQEAAAKEAATGLLDKAYFHHLNNALDESQALYEEALEKAKAFSGWRYYKWASRHFTQLLLPQYTYLQCTRKNYAEALETVEAQIAESDRSLERDLPYFSENEKREYFERYGKKLQQYYSILLSMGESDPSRLWDVLNKSIQVKGMILEATREQQRRFKSVTDPRVLALIRRIIVHRERLNAFTQLATRETFPVDDSIRHYTLAINQLQKTVNENIGTVPALLQTLTWKDIQGKLSPTEAYVEVIAIDRDNFHFDAPVRQYWVFMLPASGNPIARMIGNGRTLERQLKRYQNNIRFQEDDTESFSSFWSVVTESLPGIKKIYFNGDGVYHTINPLTFRNPDTNQFLMDEVTLIRLSTGRDLFRKDRPKPGIEVVLIGNPDFTMDRKSSTSKVQARPVDLGMVSATRSGFSMLPGTEREVNAISSYAQAAGKKVTVLTGDAASEVNVKKIANPGMIHFATHGAFNSHGKGDSYLKSMLILAGAGDESPFSLEDYAQYEDGYLTAYEVSQMDLSQTGLAVLSACETGLGDVQSGEGVWGLQRAFQVGGAGSVMGSLWKVSDDATAVFMEVFYKSLFGGNAAGAAYREAMAETRKRYPHPYFWGGFVLTE